MDDFLTENGISAETTLQVEYVRAEIPPQRITSFQHDDWVSSVDVLSSTSAAGYGKNIISADERILSASYDGLLRTWSSSGTCIATSPSAHTAPIKSVKFLSSDVIVSSSMDRSVRIWKYNETSPTSGTFTPTLELYNHTASVDRLAIHIPSQKILSASSDHTLSIFSTNKSSAKEPSTSFLPNLSSNPKRRKLSQPSKQVSQRGALSTLKSHSAPVSDVSFSPSDPSVAYSTSWDHTLKTWDLTTSICVDTRTTSHALLSILPLQPSQSNDVTGGGDALIAAGTSARHIVLIDPRASATKVVSMTLRGHFNAVVTLAKSPKDGNIFASGSHDGTVRVWDVRMGRSGLDEGEGGMIGEASYTLDDEEKSRKKIIGGEGVKIFGLQWDEKWGIVTGGEDKKVQIWQGR